MLLRYWLKTSPFQSSLYGPKRGLDHRLRDHFYDSPISVLTSSQRQVVHKTGDFNGYVGGSNYEDQHGGYGIRLGASRFSCD